MLVPVLHTMVLDLLDRGLPGDTSLWSPILSNLHEFSSLLKEYYSKDFFYLQGPYPDQTDNSPYYLLRFKFPYKDHHGIDNPRLNFPVPDHFYHPDPVKKWTLLWTVWYYHQRHIDDCLEHSDRFPADMSFLQRFDRVILEPDPVFSMPRSVYLL